MNLVDFFVWAVLLCFAVKGFLKGLIREVCSLLALVLGVWTASRFFDDVASSLGALIRLPHTVAAVVSFVLVFLLTAFFFGLLGRFLTTLSQLALLGGVNRIGGVVFGALQGAMVLALVMYGMQSKAVPQAIRTRVAGSPLGSGFAGCGGEIINGWSPVKGLAGSFVPSKR